MSTAQIRRILEAVARYLGIEVMTRLDIFGIFSSEHRPKSQILEYGHQGSSCTFLVENTEKS